MINFNDDFLSGMKCHWDKDLTCTNGMYCGLCEHQPADDDKPNGKNEPVVIDYQNDYGMMMPYCPSCGEMAYSEERCVFCGQRFKKSKRPQNKKEVEGGKLAGGVLYCQCGSADLQMVSHINGGDKFFGYEFKCLKCGNTVAFKEFLNTYTEVQCED